jgi:hypothetical protein
VKTLSHAREKVFKRSTAVRLRGGGGVETQAPSMCFATKDAVTVAVTAESSLALRAPFA